jgi:hypothetical protein
VSNKSSETMKSRAGFDSLEGLELDERDGELEE